MITRIAGDFLFRAFGPQLTQVTNKSGLPKQTAFPLYAGDAIQLDGGRWRLAPHHPRAMA